MNKIKLARKTIPLAIATMVVSVFSSISLAEKPTEKSLLWEITGPGITQPSYLFGTIHAICPTQAQLSQPVKTALAKTEQLYLEVDFDDPSLASSNQELTKLPPGKTLKTLLGNKNYAKVKEFFWENGQISLDDYINVKPYAVNQLSIDVLLKCKSVAIDSILFKNAQERRVEVLGLEELQNQASAVDKSFTDESSAAGLIALANNPEPQRQLFQQLISYYLAQDIVSIREFFNVPAAETGKTVGDNFIDSRNQNWIPKILQAAKTKPTFFGVGFGHLGGDRGVISLLRDRGYTVKPIQNLASLSTAWESPQKVVLQPSGNNLQHRKPAW
jgi:uncharacterized protein